MTTEGRQGDTGETRRQDQDDKDRRPSISSANRRLPLALLLAFGVLAIAVPTVAQEATSPSHRHDFGDREGVELFPSRDASGTAWVPDETPMDALHRRWGQWELAVHGTLFAQFLYESGDRHRTGGFQSTQVSSSNWFMVMARRHAGTGRVGFRGTVSAEPWTVANCGFINLLASGEMCEGDTIHDRQHPHDAFMELAVDYDHPLRGSVRWQVYGGLAGEPALGPAGFPHRVSAAFNPIAPIAHHWLDSTHVTFGLVTGGVYARRWKLESSVFNSREPDEKRSGVELAPLDSVSARLAYMPTPQVAMQISGGHLRRAEAEFPPQPRSDVNRVTASLTYQAGAGGDRRWATTVAYGVNGGDEILPAEAVFLITHAALLESSVTFRDRHTWFGRLEAVGKPGHDLHVHESPARVIPVGKVEAGYARHFRRWKALVPSTGVVLTANLVPEALVPRYSGHVAWGLGGYVVLRPRQHIAADATARLR